ncbi:Trifunctional UDP-glucose 4,6-dehydratase/UDP-4-keto-6-deoxy-D-glucose 3,5-epimerase/UDP-4-keto-L-rhamnose-reductase RHM3 [Dichanthelium oligosanthes]|uniref:Trifunctional UDP-glucose 4,6-dehydratase/UDP-4-keto-6-deoxy-D-glucose 3,5-epimerase/UDP-4-keto-L-rhamnose-reductase RHM3 n=1 Tax=Dichanthelium oligosanthes TaxID=888268 RepID=A0A1E5VEH2_9POAL|nr:Trifunctional UDP-glucose 4,6-dehydratase/UDP-4-keto-6-deoxy-D-glucose 3,5-epimerase/UDP-4-keto-L-rhamnose-reductase RHM3 [Dichanthelium oligosanthes]
MKNDLKCLGNILTVEVAPDIGSITMDQKGFPSHGQENELWDELLRELIRAIDIVSLSSNDWKTVGSSIGHNKHLRSSFGAA